MGRLILGGHNPGLRLRGPGLTDRDRRRREVPHRLLRGGPGRPCLHPGRPRRTRGDGELAAPPSRHVPRVRSRRADLDGPRTNAWLRNQGRGRGTEPTHVLGGWLRGAARGFTLHSRIPHRPGPHIGPIHRGRVHADRRLCLDHLRDGRRDNLRPIQEHSAVRTILCVLRRHPSNLLGGWGRWATGDRGIHQHYGAVASLDRRPRLEQRARGVRAEDLEPLRRGGDIVERKSQARVCEVRTGTCEVLGVQQLRTTGARERNPHGRRPE